MDDFREWLSDNLRYFMLGGGVLLIVLILFFGIRACMGRGKEPDPGTVPTVSNNTQDGNSGTESGGSAGAVLSQADSEVRTLIDTYYKALGDKDIDALRSVEVELSAEDEIDVSSRDYIKEYQVQEVYQVNGPSDGTYAVYAYINYLFNDISTALPALSSFYVIRDTDGALKIDGRENASVDSYFNSLQANADVAALTSRVTQASDSARAGDPALAAFLDTLSQGSSSGGSSQSQESVKMRTNSDCNVRASASTEGDVLGIYYEGSEVTVLGTEGDWTKVDYNGQTGYIFSTLLDAI